MRSMTPGIPGADRKELPSTRRARTIIPPHTQIFQLKPVAPAGAVSIHAPLLSTRSRVRSSARVDFFSLSYLAVEIGKKLKSFCEQTKFDVIVDEEKGRLDPFRGKNQAKQKVGWGVYSRK